MTTTSCVSTGSEAHDSANATFEEAASQLEDLGYLHEITSDGVAFSRGTRNCRAWEIMTLMMLMPQLPLFSV
jgi:hypothetical protein